MNHFGEHMMIDGYGGVYEKLNNKDIVLQCLMELPGKLAMKKLSDPEVYFAAGNDKKDPGGWSGFVVIEESHISIHTFPARGFVSIDVYTCTNDLDRELIINYFKKAFGITDVEENFVKRGTRYAETRVIEGI